MFPKNVLRYFEVRFSARNSSSGVNALTINDMPHPRSLPLLGTKLDFFANGRGTKLHEYIHKRHSQLGSIFAEKLGNAEIVFISDPVLMKSLFLNLEGKYPAHILPEPWVLYEKLYGSKRGLFFMDGEEWLTNRRYLNTHLLRENSLKWIENPIRKTIENFIINWKAKSVVGPYEPNLESDLYKLSINVIIAVLMGGDVSSIKSKHHEELLDIFSESVKNIFVTTTKLSGLPLALCQKYDLKVWRNFKESVDFSVQLAQKLVTEMLATRHKSDGLICKLAQDNIPDDLIIRIVSDFVIAAGDTTAYTTLWTLFLLSENYEIIEEISKDTACIKRVIKESMRLYPVAPFLTRILPKESFLGSYLLKQHTPVVASIYTSGRDEKYFSKAEQFLPYRWDRLDMRKQELPNHEPSASLPFAMGARSCIGKKIAMLQLEEVIKQIVTNFEFTCSNKGVKAVTSQVLVPDKPIKLSFTLRN